MGWDGIEKRWERRSTLTETVFPVRFQIEIDRIPYPVESINYHYAGACLRVPKGIISKIDRNAPVFVSILLGHKVLQKRVKCRIVWETLKEDGLIGIEFQKSGTLFFNRARRFPTHQHITPTLSSPDPLNPNRELYFKVTNISQTGLEVQTSLSNRHLLQGMTLKKATLTLPGETPSLVSLTIENTRRAPENGVFKVGLSFSKTDAKTLRKIKTYLSTLSPVGPERGQTLARHSMLSKAVKKGLTFSVIGTEREYEDVLKLRFCGYEMAGKIKPDSDWKDQGEGLQKEGLILGAYLGGELVASAELRFGDAGLPLRITKQTNEFTLSSTDIAQVVEINKLVVLPHVQGTDIVLGMIQKMHSIVLQKGLYDVILSATDQLIPLYQRLGFQKTAKRYEHPHVPGMQLELMRLPSEVMVRVKRIHPLAWTTVYLQTCQFLSEIGLTEPVKLTFFRKVQVYVVPKVIHLKKVMAERRRIRKSRVPLETQETVEVPKQLETGT